MVIKYQPRRYVGSQRVSVAIKWMLFIYNKEMAIMFKRFNEEKLSCGVVGVVRDGRWDEIETGVCGKIVSLSLLSGG